MCARAMARPPALVFSAPGFFLGNMAVRIINQFFADNQFAEVWLMRTAVDDALRSFFGTEVLYEPP